MRKAFRVFRNNENFRYLHNVLRVSLTLISWWGVTISKVCMSKCPQWSVWNSLRHDVSPLPLCADGVLSLSFTPWLQVQLWSGVWRTEMTDTVGTDPWEMKILHKQHRCTHTTHKQHRSTHTTHKSTCTNYVMTYLQFNGDFRNSPFRSGMLAWRDGGGAQWKGTRLAPAWLMMSLSEP